MARRSDDETIRFHCMLDDFPGAEPCAPLVPRVVERTIIPEKEERDMAREKEAEDQVAQTFERKNREVMEDKTIERAQSARSRPDKKDQGEQGEQSEGPEDE